MRYTLQFGLLVFFLLISKSFSQTGWFIIPDVTTETIYNFNTDAVGTKWMIGGNGLIMKSTDQGDTWTSSTSSTTADLHGIHQPTSNQFWVAGESGTVLISVDAGNSWSPSNVPTTANFYSVFSRGSGVGYVIGDSGSCYYSSNTGSTWNTRTVPTPENLYAGIGPTSGTSLIALVGGSNGVIFKTTDAGVNWTPISSGISDNINDFGLGAGARVFAVGNNGLIISSIDAGASWFPVSSPVTADLYSISISGQNANWMIACGSGGTIIKTTDGGDTWFQQFTPTSEDLFAALAINNSIHIAGGMNGIFLKTIDGGGDPVSVDENLNNLTDFSLSQNYPNPFNPSTKFNYVLPYSSHVIIKVFNVLGSHVTTLVDEKKPAGNYEVEFHADDFPNGVYFYQLKAGSLLKTKKMILMK